MLLSFPRSSENQITMHKCFLLLVFMVIILPSLGLSRYNNWYCMYGAVLYVQKYIYKL